MLIRGTVMAVVSMNFLLFMARWFYAKIRIQILYVKSFTRTYSYCCRLKG